LCRSSEPNERRADAGFTMIEALVALAVIAVALTAIGSLMAANVRSTRAVEQRLSLLETARALIAALPDRDQLAPGDSRGEIADERWRIDVLPFAADFVDPSQATPWVPQAVVLRVESPTGEILRVDTVRLRRAEGRGK
jgi:general secretion pathway protein I